VSHVAARYAGCTLFAAGWSLGANILVNYLAEAGPGTPLEAAVSMCNPFELTISNAALKKVRRGGKGGVWGGGGRLDGAGVRGARGARGRCRHLQQWLTGKRRGCGVISAAAPCHAT
jgi:hypothetical protein